MAVESLVPVTVRVIEDVVTVLKVYTVAEPSLYRLPMYTFDPSENVSVAETTWSFVLENSVSIAVTAA